jgi:hypothetical protein
MVKTGPEYIQVVRLEGSGRRFCGGGQISLPVSKEESE